MESTTEATPDLPTGDAGGHTWGAGAIPPIISITPSFPCEGLVPGRPPRQAASPGRGSRFEGPAQGVAR